MDFSFDASPDLEVLEAQMQLQHQLQTQSLQLQALLAAILNYQKPGVVPGPQ